MQHEMKHTAEPWHREDFAGGGRRYCAVSGYGGKHITDYVAREDADRMTACVNALAGITDPDAFVKRVKAIEEAASNAVPMMQMAWKQYGVGGMFECMDALRAALAMPGGGA